MSDLIIYGASDDLIEIEGIVSDELGAPYDRPGIVTVRVDAAVWMTARIEYTDDGVWQITGQTGDAIVIPARGEDEPNDEHMCPGYSDKLVIPMPGIESYRIGVTVEAVPNA